MPSIFKREPTVALWGDGFADDTSLECGRVSEWSQLCSDEYIRFFPRLASDEAGWGLALGRIDRSILARVWRLHHHHGVTLDATSSAIVPPEAFGASGKASHADVFAPRPAWRPWRRFQRTDARSTVADEEADLQALLSLQRHMREGRPARPEPDCFAHFAFLSGIHPGNLWPSAFASHETHAAAGWLGIVARGRHALMPLDVAEVLLDAIRPWGDGRVSIRDPSVARLIGTEENATHLHRSAKRRHAGERVIHAQRAQAVPHNAECRGLPTFGTRVASLVRP